MKTFKQYLNETAQKLSDFNKPTEKWTKDYGDKRRKSFIKEQDPPGPFKKKWDKSDKAVKYRECVRYKKDHIDYVCNYTKCPYREGCPALGPISGMYNPNKKTALQHFRDMI